MALIKSNKKIKNQETGRKPQRTAKVIEYSKIQHIECTLEFLYIYIYT